MLLLKTRSAVYWSGADIVLSQGLLFFFTVILARLLIPEDFGTIALLSIFLAVAGLFVNSGFTAALIQKHNITHLDESTVFWFNIIMGVIAMAILMCMAPWLADFFDLPVLTPLMLVMACNISIGATGSVHRTLLSKQLDFKTLMKVNAISSLISGSVGVYLALENYGVWALAGYALSSTILNALLIWYFSSWRPLLKFSCASFLRLYSFSGYIFVSSLLAVIFQRGSDILIGKLFGIRDLGLYNRANSTQLMIAQLPTNMISRVMFPVYSSLKNDVKKLRRIVRKSIRSVVLITTPMMLGLALLAEPFIHTVFGEQWIYSAPILKILCFVGILLPIHSVNVTVLIAQGHADLNLRITVVKRVTAIIFLVIGSFFGLKGIALGSVIQSIIGLLINGHYTKKFLDYSIVEQVKDCLPSLFLSLVMVIVVALIDKFLSIGGVVELLILALSGAIFYLLSNAIMGIIAFKEAIEFIKGKSSIDSGY